MNEAQENESAVAKLRSVRDELNREIEGVRGAELLDRIRRHRYTNPFLQRLALKATSKAEASGAGSGDR